MRRSSRLAAVLVIGVCLTVPATAGPAQADLPDAYRHWFVSDRSVTCVTPDGRDRRCATSAVEHVEVKRNPADTAALVFITYLPDPTAIGNATQLAAAAFRRGADGWRLVRTIRSAGGVPTGKVAFTGETGTYLVAVPKPGDPRCCPSGRRQVSIDLR
ncbi:hypothetical protein [Methylobacterium sp. Leaf85]|uniref:hypothetical protein n=1 Tax=Methylobacterium sp. Leaf85 TaxID=1736241 RepID=UPI0012E8AA83|nr:hypothetical protein [Methylobacterium sp. Leaf85]